MAALTKADIAAHLTHEVGISKSDARILVDLFYKVIMTELSKGVRVKLSRFGNFELHDKKERPGRNPKTGADKIISARRVVAFRGGQKLRARVENFNDSAKKTRLNAMSD